ncbi:MAG TPA: exo-alpha-sialidase [Bacteroides sp.]|nr:exo-alpha-sialidase [Bacteroides sp.]
MRKIIIAVAFVVLLTKVSCHHSTERDQTNGVTFIIQQDTIPVLIGKDWNPVLKILVDIPGGMNDLNLSELLINSSGTTDINDISSVSIYYTGSRESTKDPIQYGETLEPSKKMVFKGSLSLKKGENYFSVSYTLKETAKLTNRVDAGCEHIVLGEKMKIKPSMPSPPFSNRIGIALRQHGQDDCDTYRIPGLATTNEGTLIAVYDNRYNGSVDLQADVDVAMSRSTDGGQTWEPMKVIMDMGEWGDKPEDENGIGDPAVLVDRGTGTIWVAGIWAHGTPGKRNWHSSRPGIEPIITSQLMLVKSEDDGLTWSEPINLTPALKDPAWYLLLQGPGKGTTHSDGTIVFPAQFKDHENMPHSTIIWSKDHGENWSIGTGAKSNTTEAQVIELDNGSLMLNMRDNRKGSRSVYTSSDLGATWEMHPTSRSALIEPVCNASLIKGKFQVNGKEQKLVLFVNPNSTRGRQHMTVKVSTDDGMTWPEENWLLLDQGRGRGYPSMTQIDGQHIGVLYEGSQADLVFEKVHIDEIMDR